MRWEVCSDSAHAAPTHVHAGVQQQGPEGMQGHHVEAQVKDADVGVCRSQQRVPPACLHGWDRGQGVPAQHGAQSGRSREVQLGRLPSQENGDVAPSDACNEGVAEPCPWQARDEGGVKRGWALCQRQPAARVQSQPHASTCKGTSPTSCKEPSCSGPSEACQHCARAGLRVR